MRFASNPREFDSRGLPKFGAELSDDDENMQQQQFVSDDEDMEGPFQAMQSIELERNVHNLYDGSNSRRKKVDSKEFLYSRSKPSLPRNTVAYDAELDDSSDEDALS